MDNIKAIIVEDEVKGLNNLKTMLQEHCEQVKVMGEAGSVEEGLQLFERERLKPDLAFLDINLPDGQVFQLLNKLEVIDFDIIFVTAFEEYALKAFEYSSLGYIVKPIDPDKLVEAVGKVQPRSRESIQERLELFQHHFRNPNAFEKISIPAIDGIYFINIREIIRCEAEDNYTHIHLENGDRITASKTIKFYEELLSGMNFYRVHKSHLINLNYMRKFVKGDGGFLIMDDDKRIEVSRRRRPAFLEKMKQLQRGL
jgi:two-component system LytT family response regulator